MKILVTGGAGYIGSFMTKRLLNDGHSVVVVDSLERGHEEVIDTRVVFKKGNLCDKSFVEDIFSDSFDGVIHFAAYISMGESMENPYLYFHNNVQASLNLVEAMVNHSVNNFIFSSTAGVYGNPIVTPIPEDHQKNPENPYGESKLLVEKILHWYFKTKGLSFTALRYFNAAGASLDGSMGEAHEPETHIIPNVITAGLQRKPFTLFGSDYNTKDGTCVRDYIHVLDLVEAHMLALKKLQETPAAYVYNVGTGQGHSNKEVIEEIKRISGLEIAITESPRRPGDADTLIADASKIKQDLGFTPQYSDLTTIVESAWKWHQKNFK